MAGRCVPPQDVGSLTEAEYPLSEAEAAFEHAGRRGALKVQLVMPGDGTAFASLRLPLPSWLRQHICVVISTAFVAETLPLPADFQPLPKGALRRPAAAAAAWWGR